MNLEQVFVKMKIKHLIIIKNQLNGFINSMIQLDYCYINGIVTKINKEKGFELYNKKLVI